MLLGDIIARFQDEAMVSETLFSLGDLALTASVVARAAENNVTTGRIGRGVGWSIRQSCNRRGVADIDRTNVARRRSRPSLSSARSISLTRYYQVLSSSE